MCHTIFAVASNLRAIPPPPLPLRSLPNFLIPFSFSSFVPFISSFHFDGHYYMTNHDLISFANIFLLSSLRNVPFPQSQCYTVPQVYGKIYQFYHRRIRNRCRHTNTSIYGLNLHFKYYVAYQCSKYIKHYALAKNKHTIPKAWRESNRLDHYASSTVI